MEVKITDAERTQQKFQDTEELLRDWDVPELIPIFLAKNVTKDVFHLLTNDDINHLIPENDMASKFKFREKFLKYRSQCGYPMPNESAAYTNNSPPPQPQSKVIISRVGFTFIASQLISIFVFFVFVFTIFGCFYFFLIKPSMEEHAKFSEDFNKRRDQVWGG